MSNSKNSLRGILRRALAQLLAFLMIFGLATSGMGVQNAYATEITTVPPRQPPTPGRVQRVRETRVVEAPPGVSMFAA